MVEQDTIRLLRECDAGVKMGISSIDDVLDIYVYYCTIYDKEISIIGFSNLTGIDTELIHAVIFISCGSSILKLLNFSSCIPNCLNILLDVSNINGLINIAIFLKFSIMVIRHE